MHAMYICKCSKQNKSKNFISIKLLFTYTCSSLNSNWKTKEYILYDFLMTCVPIWWMDDCASNIKFIDNYGAILTM